MANKKKNVKSIKNENKTNIKNKVLLSIKKAMYTKN